MESEHMMDMKDKVCILLPVRRFDQDLILGLKEKGARAAAPITARCVCSHHMLFSAVMRALRRTERGSKVRNLDLEILRTLYGTRQISRAKKALWPEEGEAAVMIVLSDMEMDAGVELDLSLLECPYIEGGDGGEHPCAECGKPSIRFWSLEHEPDLLPRERRIEDLIMERSAFGILE